MSSDADVLADVVAIPVTPFTEGNVDLGRYEAVIRRMTDAGIAVITPNGNTGEFSALSPVERRQTIRAALALGTGATVVPGIGLDTATAIEEGRFAAAHGARFAMVHQPAGPYLAREGWIEYHAAIAHALPDVGLVLYVRAEWIDGEMLEQLVARCPNVVGVKYANPDVVAFARLISRPALAHLVWIAGLAEPYALSYSVHGARGFTSGLANVSPHVALDLRDALRSGDVDRARSISTLVDRFEQLRARDRSADNVSVVKEALAQLGLCTAEVRSPNHAVADRTRAEITDLLGAWARHYPLSTPVGVANGVAR